LKSGIRGLHEYIRRSNMEFQPGHEWLAFTFREQPIDKEKPSSILTGSGDQRTEYKRIGEDSD